MNKTIMSMEKHSVGTAIRELSMKLDTLTPTAPTPAAAVAATPTPAQPSAIVPYQPRSPMRSTATLLQLVAQPSKAAEISSSLMIKDGAEATKREEKREEENKGGGTHNIPTKFKGKGVLKIQNEEALIERKI